MDAAALDRMRTLDRIDPVRVFERMNRSPAHDWQSTAMRDTSVRKALLCARQIGKSLTCQAIVVHHAATTPNAYVAVCAHTEQLALDFVRACRAGFEHTPYASPVNSAKSEIELSNGSRIVGLSAAPDIARGRTLTMAIVDEAARVHDESFTSLLPALHVRQGTLIIASTPVGAFGYFAEQLLSDEPGWLRLTVPATESPMYSAAQLEGMRRSLGDARYRVEMLCEWAEAGGSPVFDAVDLARLFADHDFGGLAVPTAESAALSAAPIAFPSLAEIAAAATQARRQAS
jgi:hypothetical protein